MFMTSTNLSLSINGSSIYIIKFLSSFCGYINKQCQLSSKNTLAKIDMPINRYPEIGDDVALTLT